MARGTAVDGVSDLDDFVLVDQGGLDLSWRGEAAERLLARYPHVTDVGLDVVTPEEVGGTNRFSELALLMVTHTACVWREDVIPPRPGYRPGVLVANNDVVQIGSDIEEAMREPTRDSSRENARYWRRRISKNVVRAGFSERYPEREMSRTVEYALEQSPDAAEVLGFLDGFGSWMSEAAEDWLDRLNPSRELARDSMGSRKK